MTTGTVMPFRSPAFRPGACQHARTRRAALAALAAAPTAGLPVVAGAAGTEDPQPGR